MHVCVKLWLKTFRILWEQNVNFNFVHVIFPLSFITYVVICQLQRWNSRLKNPLYRTGCTDRTSTNGYNSKHARFTYISVTPVKNWLVFEAISIDCDYIPSVAFASHVLILVIRWYAIRVARFNPLLSIHSTKK